MRVRNLVMVALVWWVGTAMALGVEIPGLTTYHSRYYTIHTNLSKGEVKPYGAHMDLIFSEYRSRFSKFRPKNNNPMPLYLLATQDQYLGVLKRFEINGKNTSGIFFVQPGGQGLATWTRGRSRTETFSVLQHEGFHQFAFSFIGTDLPKWVNEGIAQYFEDGIVVKGRMMLGLSNYMRTKAVQKALNSKREIGFEELLNISSKSWNDMVVSNPERASLLYDQSWLVAYFLIHGGSGKYRGAFDDYLKLVSKGRDSEDAFKVAFKTRETEQFRQRWVEYAGVLKSDPVTMAVKRMQYLGFALEWLHEKGVAMPKDINELKQVLRERRMRFTWSVNGIVEKFDSAEDDWYVYPTTSENESMAFELMPTASVGNDMPPRISAMKLKPRPTLVWSRDYEGKLVQDVEFK